MCLSVIKVRLTGRENQEGRPHSFRMIMFTLRYDDKFALRETCFRAMLDLLL